MIPIFKKVFRHLSWQIGQECIPSTSSLRGLGDGRGSPRGLGGEARSWGRGSMQSGNKKEPWEPSSWSQHESHGSCDWQRLPFCQWEGRTEARTVPEPVLRGGNSCCWTLAQWAQQARFGWNARLLTDPEQVLMEGAQGARAIALLSISSHSTLNPSILLGLKQRTGHTCYLLLWNDSVSHYHIHFSRCYLSCESNLGNKTRGVPWQR